MIAWLPWAAGLVRGWTRLYTTGLPEELRAERLAEVESDLWDQQVDDNVHEVGAVLTSKQILVRLVAGMPADVAWRFERRRSSERRRGMLDNIHRNGWKRSGLWALTLLLAGFYLAAGVGISVGMEDSSLAAKLTYGFLVFAFGACILAGFVVMPRAPILGAALVVVGTMGGAAMMFWLVVVGLPLLAVAVAAFGIHRARGFLRQRPDSMGPPKGMATS